MKGGSVGTRRRGPAGTSFIEIVLATVVMALALIPVFALITGGLVRTDLNVSYTTGSQILRSVMSNLLSDSFRFNDIPVSAAGTYRDPSGSVAADPRLDPVFSGDAYEIDGTNPRRAISKNGLRYFVELWVANYGGNDDIRFSYLDTPVIDYYSDEKFVKQLVLSDADYAGFSPYNGSLPASSLVTGSAWATRVVTVAQNDVTEEEDDGTGTMVFQNFKKLVLRVSWETGADNRRGSGSRVVRDLWLVSFRANLSE